MSNDNINVKVLNNGSIIYSSVKKPTDSFTDVAVQIVKSLGTNGFVFEVQGQNSPERKRLGNCNYAIAPADMGINKAGIFNGRNVSSFEDIQKSESLLVTWKTNALYDLSYGPHSNELTFILR
jgi:hypothetical protein